MRPSMARGAELVAAVALLRRRHQLRTRTLQLQCPKTIRVGFDVRDRFEPAPD
jgi:hypothetical protein